MSRHRQLHPSSAFAPGALPRLLFGPWPLVLAALSGCATGAPPGAATGPAPPSAGPAGAAETPPPPSRPADDSVPPPPPASVAGEARAAAPPLAWVNPARCLSPCGSPPAAPLLAVNEAGLPDPRGPHRVASAIQSDLAAVIAAARAAGHPVKINSAHRSYQEQAELFRTVKKAGWVARPGHSEHELGTAVDLAIPTPASAAWLAEHGPSFGFTLSYPRGKQRLTGYRPEPWHLRHVGRELAEEIARQEITLEELFRTRPELAASGSCEDCPAPISRVPCGKVTDMGSCRGPVLTWCFDGALARVDCAAFGQRCARDPETRIPDCRPMPAPRRP